MSPAHPIATPRLRVRTAQDPARSQVFAVSFRIGRTEDCEFCVRDEHVSRKHVEVILANGQWTLHDLASANGVYSNGERVAKVEILGDTAIRLGVLGPFIQFSLEAPATQATAFPVPVPVATAPKTVPIAAATIRTSPAAETIQQTQPTGSIAKPVSHYLGDPNDATVGDHTRMLRSAFAQERKKDRRKYVWVAGALAIAALGGAGYGYFEHQQTEKNREHVQDLFYAMKSLDVDIANLEKAVAGSGDAANAAKVKDYQNRRKSMEDNYNRFLASAKAYDAKMSPQDKLILRVARIFGECDVAAPPEFLAEVKEYIKKWQSTGRFLADVKTAQENGYTDFIAHEMLARDLPPQFFYLAMQESNFDPYAAGPETAYGIAKGMWQFIPETGKTYGLKPGPLYDTPRRDPGDDRHHWDRETVAAASYMKDLYTTDAQASGLLVMACYNWGEGSVLPLVRSLPPNPRERNFWKLLTKYREKIPQETYDYVFYITSAAVIGENPRLFGVNCDNPLAKLDAR